MKDSFSMVVLKCTKVQVTPYKSSLGLISICYESSTVSKRVVVHLLILCDGNIAMFSK